MRTLRPWLRASALALTLASCAAPPAGLAPFGPAGQGSPAPLGPSPLVVAPSPIAPPPASGGEVVLPPVAPDARVRLQGSVTYQGQPVADATLTALDLATGQALTLTGWTAAGTGSARTDTAGAFDLALPGLADDRVVKLIAAAGSQTFTTVLDARGRAVGAADAPGARYGLQQGGAALVTLGLRLSPASTAATEAFEGALKLTFQLPPDARPAERLATLAAVQRAARQVEEALSARPGLALGLVASVGPDGRVRDLDTFRSTVARLGIFDALFEAVRGRLVVVAAQPLASQAGLLAINAEDFPLDRVRIGRDGALAFTGGSLRLGGESGSGFEPTSERRRRRRKAEVVELPVFFPFTPPADSNQTVISELVALGPNELLVGGAPRLFRLDLLTSTTGAVRSADGAADWVFQNNEFVAAARSRRTGVNAVLLSLFTPDKLALFDPATNGLVPLLAELHRAIGASRARYYSSRAAQGMPVHYYDQQDVQASGVVQLAGGATWTLDNPSAMAVYDDGAAPATILVAHRPGAGGVVIEAAQEGGASRTVASLGNITLEAMAVDWPTLYVTRNRRSVLAVNVNTGAQSTFIAATGPAGVVLEGLRDMRAITLDDPDQPRYLFVSSGAEYSPNRRVWRVPLP